jgi:predicted AlkP superfamily phosphohydrolase/phosphomutase
MKPAHPQRPARPLLVIGWDGADPDLVEPWIADGTLPNLARLAEQGSFSRLRSLIHPLSPAAWTSAFTGLNPGRHGVWDFGHVTPGTYEVAPTDARQRHGATLWDIAGDCGLRSVVINVPLSHPSGPLEGVFVPGVGASELAGNTRPESLAGLIKAEVPGYVIDANAYEHADPADFLRSVEAMVEARTQVAESLLQRERPDLLVCVYVATDRVQHAFWKQADQPGWRFRSAVEDCYVQLDDALGRLLAAAGDDAAVLVVSDHGFGDLDGDLYLNAVLEEMGLLAVRRPPSTRRWWRRRSAVEEEPRTFGDIDWATTSAYARGLFGCIWLNLRGREPNGQVEPGPEAEELLARITERLLELRHEREPLIDAVFRGEELYAGPHTEFGPDLVVVPHEYRWMTRSGREIGPRGVITTKAAVRHSGNHRMDGVLVAAGPGIEMGALPGTTRLLDLTPTCLALLGIEVPRGLDGRPMTNVLSCDVGWTDELPWRDPPTSGGSPEAALEDQLRGLGYLAR